MRRIPKTVLVLAIVLSVISGTSVGISPEAFAQDGRSSERPTTPTVEAETKSDRPLRVRPNTADPKPGGKLPESSGTPNYRIDPATGRTIWDVEDPDIDIIEPGPDFADGKPVPVPKEDIPEGFVPGESTYLPEMSDEFTHVFLNPDSTLSVTYTELPSVVDQKTGLPTGQDEELRPSERGWEIATRNGTLAIPETRGKPQDPGAPEPLVELGVADVGDFSVSVRGQNPDRQDTPDLPGEGRATPDPKDDKPETPAKADEAKGNVNFIDLVPGIDANVTPLSNGVKIDFTAATPEAATSLVEELTVPKGWTFEQGAGIILLLDDKGQQAGVWAGGLAFDANGDNETDVAIELVEANNGTASAKVVVDEEWVNDPDRVFPVTIDPVVTIGATADTWAQAGSTVAHATSSYLRAGVTGGAYSRSYLKFNHFFDVYTNSEGFKIQSATLGLLNNYSGSCTAASRWVRRVTQDWNETTLVWTNKPTSTDTGKVNNTTTFGASGCPDNWLNYDVTGIVDYWSTTPGSNYGFELRSDEVAGANFKQYYSNNNAGGYHPYLQVTYVTHGVYLSPIETSNGSPAEALLPVPDSTTNGQYPIDARNRGVLNWPAGDPVETDPDPKRVNLSYHITGAGQTPPPSTWAGLGQWPIAEGTRTSPTVQSNQADFFANSATQTASGWAEQVTVLGSHYTTPGVRDVYFTAIHDGVIWFETAGNDMLKVPTRWTRPPQITSPVNGATYSIVEPVVFDIDPPYASGTGAWTPTEYRVTFYNQLQQEIGTPVTSPTGQITVQPSEIGGATGPVSACVQARDGNLELANGPQLWTNCEWTNIVRTGVQLGVNPQGQSFAGVDAATGNYYTPFVDFDPAGVADGFSLVRHVNSLDDTAGIFGPGISTAFEGRSSIYPPSFTACATDPTSGDCTMSIIEDDGSRMLFEWDATASKWVDIAGGPTTGAIDGPGLSADFVVTYKDGSSRRYDSFGLGEITEMVSPEGHKLSVVLDPTKLYNPSVIRDEESGRTINLNYSDLDPNPNKELWLVTSATVNDGTQTLTWNYSYQNGFLGTTTDPRGFVTNYTWLDHDSDPNTPNRLDTITWPANGRLINLDYDVQGRVTQVADGEANTTDLTYPTSSQTVVVDANNKTCTVDYDAQARVTKLTDPGTTSTQYEYEGAYRDKVIDATGLQANLAYDDDGNLTSRTNAANETTYYRYDTTGGYYGNNDIITGPSHVCDARSSGPTDNTYCTISKYDSYGNLIYRATPSETAAEAEEWIYTTGSEGAVGGGTMPAGLLKEHRDGNTTAQGGEGTTTFAYDSKGDLRQRTDPSGLVTEWTYDLLGRQTTEKATYTDNGVSKTVTLSTMTYDKNSKHQDRDRPTGHQHPGWFPSAAHHARV